MVLRQRQLYHETAPFGPAQSIQAEAGIRELPKHMWHSRPRLWAFILIRANQRKSAVSVLVSYPPGLFCQPSARSVPPIGIPPSPASIRKTNGLTQLDPMATQKITPQKHESRTRKSIRLRRN